MKIKTIYLTESKGFGQVVTAWAEEKGFDVKVLDSKTNVLDDLTEGVTLFHENHNFSRETVEMHEAIVKENIPGYKVDLNGTLMATVNNFSMWLDRNRPQKLLILGEPELAKNKNLERFLEKLG